MVSVPKSRAVFAAGEQKKKKEKKQSSPHPIRFLYVDIHTDVVTVHSQFLLALFSFYLMTRINGEDT